MLSPYVKNKIIDELTGNSASMDLGTIYFGLSKTTPTVSGNTVNNVTEPSGNGYSRVLIGMSSQSLTRSFASASEGQARNNVQIKFDMATGSWGTCTHGVLFDAKSGGNVLAYASLTSSVSPENGELPIVAVGDFTISITDVQ